MANNQIYWQQADWDLLKAYIYDRTKYPAGFAVDHKFFEDVRKILWLLEHIHAGNYDDSALEWNPESLPVLSPPNAVYKHTGVWEVTTQVNVHGVNRWVRWLNIRDFYKSEFYSGAPPFMGPPTNIHPEKNVWVLSNANWEFAPSPNYYYDWDYNSRAVARWAASDGDYLQTAAPAAYYPRQTDP